MRTFLAYTGIRAALLVVAGVLFYLCGARGFLLLILSFAVTAILSYILLGRQRQKVADALNRRVEKATSKASGKMTEFKSRLEEGTASEDEANEAVAPGQAPGVETPAAKN
jgi:uncharacterized protein (DUF58 family)